MVYTSIEAERARRGFTKEELAARIGVSVKTYYNWINGTNPIPSTALIKMADIFKTDIDYLLGRNKDRSIRSCAGIKDFAETEREVG